MAIFARAAPTGWRSVSADEQAAFTALGIPVYIATRPRGRLLPAAYAPPWALTLWAEWPRTFRREPAALGVLLQVIEALVRIERLAEANTLASAVLTSLRLGGVVAVTRMLSPDSG